MNHLGLFAKFWQPGRVKTRLAADLGEKSACQTYQYFLSHSINQLRETGHTRTIVYSPPDREPEFQAAAGKNWQTVAQSDGDLGQRMQKFFEFSFQATASKKDSDPIAKNLQKADETVRKTIVIGSDCPQLTPDDIETAFTRLDEHPVVLGPSHDGGYYLIGMRNECVDIFDQIEWSTDQVLPQTRARLVSLGTSWSELDEKTDIDDIDTLLTYHAQMKEVTRPGNSDFVLCGALDAVISQYRQRGEKV